MESNFCIHELQLGKGSQGMLETLTLKALVANSLGLVRVSVRTANLRVVIAAPRHDGSVPLHFRDHLVSVTQILRQPGGITANSTAVIRTVRADSEARFSQGEEALVFLASPVLEAFEYNIRDDDTEWNNAPVFRVFGGFQGKFTVERGEEVPVLYQPGQPPLPFDRLTALIEAPVEERGASLDDVERFRTAYS